MLIFAVIRSDFTETENEKNYLGIFWMMVDRIGLSGFDVYLPTYINPIALFSVRAWKNYLPVSKTLIKTKKCFA